MATRKDGTVQNVNEGRTASGQAGDERSKELNRLQDEDQADSREVSTAQDEEEEDIDDEELQESDFDIDDDEKEETGGEG